MSKHIVQINCPEDFANEDPRLLQDELGSLRELPANDNEASRIVSDSSINEKARMALPNRQKSLFEPVKLPFGAWVGILIMFFTVVALVLPSMLPREEVPLPNFSIAQNSELPGEAIIRGSSSDMELIATVTDQIDAKDDQALSQKYYGSNNIWIHFDNDKAGSKSANLVTTITRDGQEPQIQKDTLYPYIRVDDLPYGETKLTITAENTAGKVEKTLTVTKTTYREACDANPANKTNRYCSHFYKTEETPAPTLPNHSGSGCVHYESGQCWDEIEDEAYENGRWDKDFGSYGGGYNPPANCTGICKDIYDEAYMQGYEDW